MIPTIHLRKKYSAKHFWKILVSREFYIDSFNRIDAIVGKNCVGLFSKRKWTSAAGYRYSKQFMTDLTYFCWRATPPEAREEMAQARRQLANFCTMIGHISHRALRLLLAPTPVWLRTLLSHDSKSNHISITINGTMIWMSGLIKVDRLECGKQSFRAPFGNGVKKINKLLYISFCYS